MKRANFPTFPNFLFAVFLPSIITTGYIIPTERLFLQSSVYFRRVKQTMHMVNEI